MAGDFNTKNRKVREMRTAGTVLGVIRERGRKGLPLEGIYRQLYNPELYLRAYARIYSNDGAMTPGVTEETVDAMSMQKIQQLINDIRAEKYRWTPTRRTHIPKKNGKLRPLGIPIWKDKLLQEVIRQLLEAYYEPQFSQHAHGFRPLRGCHTALKEVKDNWTGTKWFIEGDIKGCFDNIKHEVLLSILQEKIHDNRFIRLIDNLLRAGYLENWEYHQTLSGTPQGGICSPILSNIYLDKLDKYVEQILLPQYNRGKMRGNNNRYFAIMMQASRRRKQGKYQEAKKLRQEAQKLPSRDPQDPNYRRLYYVRYADDWLCGFIGSRDEAEKIKQSMSEFLREELKLELSQEKTLISHAQTQPARFLGYELVSQHCDTRHDQTGRRSINGVIGLRVPIEILEKKCKQYQRGNKPGHRSELMENTDFSIIYQYQSEYRGFVQYYLLAQNVSWLWKLHWNTQGSLLKTLAAKYKTSVKKVKEKYLTTTDTPHGPMMCLEIKQERNNGKSPLIARFGGIPLRKQETAILKDKIPLHKRSERTEILKRLLADKCELCEKEGNCEVHHIRKLADLERMGTRERPYWAKVMATRRRKTLVVCQKCHDDIHAGKVKPSKQITGERYDAKVSRTVRRGAQ